MKEKKQTKLPRVNPRESLEQWSRFAERCALKPVNKKKPVPLKTTERGKSKQTETETTKGKR